MPNILFLMSDTGGGHRAAATAIIDALQDIDSGHDVTTAMVDFIATSWRPPLNKIGQLYRPIVDYAPWFWALLFYGTDNVVIRHMTLRLMRWAMTDRMIDLFRTQPADMVVSVHPFATTVPARILARVRPGVPFVTVVTDLYTAHPLWFTPETDHCFVPTDEVRQRALLAGLRAEQITITGLPIDPCFSKPTPPAHELKRGYGLPPERPLVLLMGGGEGMGPLEDQAMTLATSGIPISLMIIAGRNKKLRRRLESRTWPAPVVVSGFVRDIPHRMAAADVIVTKAGPGTISEALAASQPILISDYIPGQEKGNVAWIEDSAAGRFVPTLPALRAALRDLFDSDGSPTATYETMTARAHDIAQPEAAYTIACELLHCIR